MIPTVIARDGDSALIHGSTGSGWMRQAATGRPACITVTDLSGIIARSSFENSLRYRSAALFGTFTRLAEADVPRARPAYRAPHTGPAHRSPPAAPP